MQILASGCVRGALALSSEEAAAKIERGYRIIVMGYDGALLQRAAVAVREGIRAQQQGAVA